MFCTFLYGLYNRVFLDMMKRFYDKKMCIVHEIFDAILKNFLHLYICCINFISLMSLFALGHLSLKKPNKLEAYIFREEPEDSSQ